LFLKTFAEAESQSPEYAYIKESFTKNKKPKEVVPVCVGVGFEPQTHKGDITGILPFFLVSDI